MERRLSEPRVVDQERGPASGEETQFRTEREECDEHAMRPQSRAREHIETKCKETNLQRREPREDASEKPKAPGAEKPADPVVPGGPQGDAPEKAPREISASLTNGLAA